MKIQRKDGLTIIELNNVKIKTRAINRHTYNRLRKQVEAGTLQLYQVLGAIKAHK